MLKSWKYQTQGKLLLLNGWDGQSAGGSSSTLCCDATSWNHWLEALRRAGLLAAVAAQCVGGSHGHIAVGERFTGPRANTAASPLCTWTARCFCCLLVSHVASSLQTTFPPDTTALVPQQSAGLHHVTVPLCNSLRIASVSCLRYFLLICPDADVRLCQKTLGQTHVLMDSFQKRWMELV